MTMSISTKWSYSTKRGITAIVVATCLSFATQAQELNCNVTINSESIQGTNKSVFNTLQQSITDFMNQTRFTQMVVAEKERIDCSMLIVVKSVESDLFKCEATIQSKRPVYNASYTTPILNLKDNHFNFKYQEYDRLDFAQPNQISFNLTAMLEYFAYLIIGHDLDSFEKMGGQPCFQVCESIVNSAQSASFEQDEQTGWKAFESNRNRYAMINNILDEVFHSYREYCYTYHRLGMDQMTANAANARARIAAGLPILREVYRSRPTTYIINTFLDAKADELTEIFKKGTTEEKKTAYETLMAIDPTRENTYAKINEK